MNVSLVGELIGDVCQTNRTNHTTATGLTIQCISHDCEPEGIELSHQNWIGLIIALGANAVIPAALNLQKYAHTRNTDSEGKQKQPYTRIPLWWLGISMMVGGEFFNLLAYGYAPTALVAPVGAVGVFFNGIIASACMKESFSWRDLVGLICIAGGVVMVVKSVPDVQLDINTDVIWRHVLPEPKALGYLIVVATFIPLWTVLAVRKHAKSHVLVYLLLCAAISSVTVVASRAFSSILTLALEEWDFTDLFHPISLGALLLIVVTAIWSTAYLNKAMMLFENNVVVPAYYCTFTVASVSSGALVYSETACMDEGWVLFVAGCLLTFLGVFVVCMAHDPKAKEKEIASKKKKESKNFVRLMEGPLPLPAVPPFDGASCVSQATSVTQFDAASCVCSSVCEPVSQFSPGSAASEQSLFTPPKVPSARDASCNKVLPVDERRAGEVEDRRQQSAGVRCAGGGGGAPLAAAAEGEARARVGASPAPPSLSPRGSPSGSPRVGATAGHDCSADPRDLAADPRDPGADLRDPGAGGGHSRVPPQLAEAGAGTGSSEFELES